MESFELNKILGAVLGVCLSAGAIFAPTLPAKPGFAIAVKEPDSGAQAPKKALEQPIENLLTTANVDHGKDISKVCMACHTLQKGEPNNKRPKLLGRGGGARRAAPT